VSTGRERLTRAKQPAETVTRFPATANAWVVTNTSAAEPDRPSGAGDADSDGDSSDGTGAAPTGDRAAFAALYLTRFAGGFGFVTLVTLLPTYIDLYDPSGIVIGLFTTALTAAQTAAIIPLAWAGDRYDKRAVLLGSLALAGVVYAGFALVGSSLGFVLARAGQGVVVTGASLMSLALVGELSPVAERANHIGKANAARFAAGIVGTLSAGGLYELFGFEAVYAVLVGLSLAALVGVGLFVAPDPTTVRGFPFRDLAVNRRILTMTGFRAQYAVAVTLVRTWVPIFAGVSAGGGLAYGAVAVSLVITAEKFTNMLAQPFTGRLSDSVGRAPFVALGGGTYGLVALAVPLTPAAGAALGLPGTFPVLGPLSPAFLPLLGLNALLGVADSVREPASMALFADEGADGDGVASSFGVRELVWRPGSVLAPLAGGLLTAGPGIEWVFYLGGVAAFSGVAVFLAALVRAHGTDALRAW
jgi:MFS family permease